MLIKWIHFGNYVAKGYLKWELLLGGRVKNKKLGVGTVIKIEDNRKFYVNYGNAIKCHIFESPLDDFFFPLETTELENPETVTQLVLEAKERRRQRQKLEQRLRTRIDFSITLSRRALKSKIDETVTHPELDNLDIQLALNWGDSPNLRRLSANITKNLILAEFYKDPELGRLLSARAAEKAAMLFFHRNGYAVEDISIKQVVDPQSTEWKTHDLRINGCPVDVKNSRRSKSNKYTYVRHCVPRFKQSRRNEDVAIVGVLSNHLCPRHILEPEDANCDTKISILGTTTGTRISALKKEFERPDFLRIDISSSGNAHQFLPPWVFEYGPAFYKNRNEAITRAKQLLIPELKLWQIWQGKKNDVNYQDINILPILIASEVSLDETWGRESPEGWKWTLVAKINSWRARVGLSLPFLFCSILSHFLEMITSRASFSSYDPREYRQLLFFDRSSSDMPLFIYDPLKTIESLIETLTTLWHAGQANVRDYHIFRLRGFNILQGKETLSDSLWKTLVAYCGKCGYMPLVLGHNDHCPKCGKLICRKCGYCSQRCLRRPSNDCPPKTDSRNESRA